MIDRIRSEVEPILDKYDVVLVQDGDLCLLNNFGEYQDQLTQFQRKSSYRGENQCRICDKSFQNEDYLELHVKQNHYRSHKLQDQYYRKGTVCPAELCDIFECPELSFKKLGFQVYMERSTGNYEGNTDKRQNNYRRNKDLEEF